MEIDRWLHHDEALEGAAVAGGGIPPGKSTLTSRLAAPASIIFRVADENVARVLGEAMGGTKRQLQRHAEGGRDANGVAHGAEEAVERAAGGSGEPLRADLREKFEQSLGADLSGVRVHVGGASAEANAAVGAKAYTTGNDIHFGAGHYQPDDPFGMHLIAHEVAHTVQQAGGAVSRQHKLEVSTPGDASEVEADRAADAMVKGETATIVGVSRQVARVPDAGNNPDAGPPEKPMVGTAYTKADKTEVVDHAGHKQKVIETVLGRETPVTLTHEAGSHFKVRTASGTVGYILRGELELEKKKTAEEHPSEPGNAPKEEVPAENAQAKVGKNDPWTPPTADSVPHESVDPRVPTERPASPAKVWNPPAPVGWRYWPGNKQISPRGKQMTDEALKKPMGTFVQDVVNGELIAARTEWHSATVKYDANKKPYQEPGVFHAGNLMLPLEQPKELPKKVQRAADPAKRQHKLEVSGPEDASETEADRAADAMVKGAPAAIAGVARQVARKMGPELDDPAPATEPGAGDAEALDDKKVGKNDPWTPPVADHVPHESVDPRVPTEKPASPGKVWNPPAPVGWRYWPDSKKIEPRGKQMADEAKKKPMGTFVQDVVKGELIAARTEWHNATVKFDENKKPYSVPGVFHAGNLMIPLEQPKELPKQADKQQSDDVSRKRQYKLEVSTPGDASEVEADRAADAMVSGGRAEIRGVARQVAREPGGPGGPDAGPAETPKSGTAYAKKADTEVVDHAGHKQKVIEKLGFEAPVTLMTEAGSHYKVTTPSGTVGYVLKGDVTFEKAKEPEKEKEKEEEKKKGPVIALKRPHGLAEIIEVFGKPGTGMGLHTFLCGKGGKPKEVYCHNKVAPLFKAVFENIVADGHGAHIHYFDGCYNEREKVGGTGKSAHAWGIACDINPEGNGRVPGDTPPDKIPVSESQKIIAPYFEQQGFVWGREFGDSMHFQYCTGY